MADEKEKDPKAAKVLEARKRELANLLSQAVIKTILAPMELLLLARMNVNFLISQGIVTDPAYGEGFIQMIASMYSKSGILGFFKGNSLAVPLLLLSHILSSMSPARKWIADKMKPGDWPFGLRMMLMSLPEFVITYPIDLVYTVMVCDVSNRFSTFWDVCVHLLEVDKSGSIFYNGLGVSLLWFCTQYIIWDLIGDFLRVVILRPEPGEKYYLEETPRSKLYYLFSRVLRQTALLPLEVVRRRMMLFSIIPELTNKSGFFAAETAVQEGMIIGFFRVVPEIFYLAVLTKFVYWLKEVLFPRKAKQI
jgi:hypothetical protein